MNIKLLIVLFATALGAIITIGCNRNQNSESSGDNLTNSPPSVTDTTNLATTNSMGSVNTPPMIATNLMAPTNNP